MDDRDQRIAKAVGETEVIRPPRQALATFGTTAIRYYLVTEPSYSEIDPGATEPESVVREGVVRAERPQVVTPHYLLRHEGFGENAGEYLQHLMQRYGPDAPGLLYTYKNEGMEMSLVSGEPREVASRIAERLDRDERTLEAVLIGPDDLWDVSLMKFIYEVSTRSLRSNVSELSARGLLQPDGGVPRDARERIERMLEEARQGNLDPAEVHRELERWELFEEYQDRFLGLFRRH